MKDITLVFKRKIVAKCDRRYDYGYYNKTSIVNEVKMPGCKHGETFEQMLKINLGNVQLKDEKTLETLKKRGKID